ncbi:class I SAM-dependent methyltransferase [Xylophilus sp. GOD-11R]|uniref:class I SAM-dependent methyltransferase n=1 Tax=Xylophilus sp. GOD-11R TaxID=3089814 RepID=UPI00298CFD16|nr:methyltransferase domain-containing protein [Xylophilus sp. GOD-11R]WPB59534.1 methyltransferase domain-containing protein [Xylophilus sp. GOD-11R]
MKTILHIGCGYSSLKNLPQYFQSGEWDEIRVDIDEAVKPDIVASLQDLSVFEDGSIDVIYSSHNIEHIWAYEVPGVLAEFERVLSAKGVAVVLCPDLASVAQGILNGRPDDVLYESPAGPISAIDVLYGFGADLARGRHYMAHKTGFTAPMLAEALLNAGFSSALVARDRFYGLHSAAFKGSWTIDEAQQWGGNIFPSAENVLEAQIFQAG